MATVVSRKLAPKLAGAAPGVTETFVREAEHDEFLGRYDANGDGRVSREEFPGSAEAFRRADRNGDGCVNAQDR